MKKIPLRRCVVTNDRLPKNDLFRIVHTPQGTVELDQSGKMNGHGAYLSKSKEVIEKARKNKALNKELGINVPDELYDKLIENL